MSQGTLFGPGSHEQDGPEDIGTWRRGSPSLERDAQASLKKQFHAELDDGVVCPTCNRFAKRYKRRLGAQQVVWLMWLVRAFERTGEWVCVQDTAPWARHPGGIVGGDYGKLVHWGLITPRLNDDPTKKSSGYWKPTQQGIDFVLRRVKVPSHVYLYNNCVNGWGDGLLTIDECLGVKFDYAELMGHTGIG